MDADRKRLTRSQPFTRVSVWPSGGRPACRRAGHPARRILVGVSPSIPRSELPFRAARCRPLRQPGWLPLHPQPTVESVYRSVVPDWTFRLVFLRQEFEQEETTRTKHFALLSSFPPLPPVIFVIHMPIRFIGIRIDWT